MSENNTHTTRIHGTAYFFCTMLLAILAGCTAHHAKQESASDDQGVICDKDTDTFCIENDQQRSVKLNQQGFELASMGKYDEALKLFEQAIELDDSNQEYYYNKGVAYSFKGMVAEEEAAYLEGLKTKPVAQNFHRRNPTLADIYYNLVCLYALQGKKEQAFEYLSKLTALDFEEPFRFSPNDKDLDSLRDDPRFQVALDKLLNSGKSANPAQPLPQ